ncbi:putative bifunctional diguanylate cyclase/phosphodiesterase [Lacrimispora brassicae]
MKGNAKCEDWTLEGDFKEEEQVLRSITEVLEYGENGEAIKRILELVGTYLCAAQVVILKGHEDETKASIVCEWKYSGNFGELCDSNPYQYNLNLDIICQFQRQGWFITETPNPVSEQRFSYAFPLQNENGYYGILWLGECARLSLSKNVLFHFLSEVSHGTLKLIEKIEKLVRQQNIPSLPRLFPEENTLIDYDWRTMLPNRPRFECYMRTALLNAEKSGQKGYVIMIDVDDFRLINREYSFETGDRLITVISNYLADTFSKRHSLFRIGTDSFLLVNTYGDEEQLTWVTNTIYKRCQSLWQVDEKTLYCTVSMTAVQYPDHGNSVEQIYRNLFNVMYQVKGSGKNSILLYQEQSEYISNVILRHQEIEKMLRDSISNQYRGFQLNYQPLYHTEADKLIGAEALVRFTSNKGIRIPPQHFIPLAEADGLIVPIGDYVLQNAAIFCKTVNNMIDPEFSISINVSIRQFQLLDYAKRVETLLSDVGVSFQNIILEITEGLAAANIERIRNTCIELRKLGIRIALDDLGTGYSSLNMLRTMPVDIIKIDRSFIKDITTDTYSHHFVGLITELGHTLNLKVCAEGVEDAVQLARCKDLGIDCIQGYYFHRPMSKDQFLEGLMNSWGHAARTS